VDETELTKEVEESKEAEEEGTGETEEDPILLEEEEEEEEEEEVEIDVMEVEVVRPRDIRGFELSYCMALRNAPKNPQIPQDPINDCIEQTTTLKDLKTNKNLSYLLGEEAPVMFHPRQFSAPPVSV